MDDRKRTSWGYSFEGVEINPKTGNAVALFSNPRHWGEALAPVTEDCLLENTESHINTLKTENLPDDVALEILEEIESMAFSRKALQEFKTKAGIPLLTPAVDLSDLPKLEDFDPAANDYSF